MTTAHSETGASSMYRWSACPGSVRECKKLPKYSTSYAEEGTDAHGHGADCLNTGKDAWDVCPDAEMAEAVQVYLDYVRSLVKHCKPGEMHVVDYKHGAGLAVEATGNPQLRYYGLGAIVTVPPADHARLLVEHKFDLSSVHPGCFGTADAVVVGAGHTRRIYLHIVQPRCPHSAGPIRTEVMDAIDMLEFRADLIQYAKATEDENAPLHPGEHCRFCPAAGVCKALHGQATKAAMVEFRPALPYDPAALAQALGARDAVKAWLKNVDEFAYREAEAGRCPPGYKLVDKRATRSWHSEGNAAGFLEAAGLDAAQIYEPRSLKSPAQIEAVFGKKKVPAELAAHIKSESSGKTLVHESDARPPARSSAATEFSPVLFT